MLQTVPASALKPAPGAVPLLAVTDLHAAYGQSEVLHGIDLTLAPAEIVAVMGRNGMGKSTLMRTLMGILPVKSGTIRVGGRDVTALKATSASPPASPTCRKGG